jgi:hypothetical protein
MKQPDPRVAATINMAINPMTWVHWPRLPLVRDRTKDGPLPERQFGFLVEGGGATVFEGLIFMPPPAKEPKKWVYDGVEDMVTDGWLVD